MGCVGLTAEILGATGEILVPCGAGIILGGTPIVVVTKTANNISLQVNLVQLVFRWQKPVGKTIQHKIITNSGCYARCAASVYNSRGIGLSRANSCGCTWN